MSNHVKNRTMSTVLVESDDPLNLRIISETIAKNIMRGALHNDRKRTI